jgi:hypothetical protein
MIHLVLDGDGLKTQGNKIHGQPFSFKPVALILRALLTLAKRSGKLRHPSRPIFHLEASMIPGLASCKRPSFSEKIQKLQSDGMLMIAMPNFHKAVKEVGIVPISPDSSMENRHTSPFGLPAITDDRYFIGGAENKKSLLNQEGLWDGLEFRLNGRRRRTPS